MLLPLLVACDTTSSEREKTVCGRLQERFRFWQWSLFTPAPNPAVANNPLVDHITFVAGDGKKLKGYKYQAHNDDAKPQAATGYILVVLGNAMIASRTVEQFRSFANAGFDVYSFDYRGYGESEGNRRFNAFIEDYQELIADLNQQYQQHYLYGISLGGAVVANLIGQGASFDKAVIDSSPSRFSPYGCEKRIDPVENMPADAKNILLIAGKLDPVVTPAMTSELRDIMQSNNGNLFYGEDYSHPFMDTNISTHLARMQRVIAFFNSEN